MHLFLSFIRFLKTKIKGFFANLELVIRFLIVKFSILWNQVSYILFRRNKMLDFFYVGFEDKLKFSSALATLFSLDVFCHCGEITTIFPITVILNSFLNDIALEESQLYFGPGRITFLLLFGLLNDISLIFLHLILNYKYSKLRVLKLFRN